MKKTAVVFIVLALLPVLMVGFFLGALFFRGGQKSPLANTSTVIQQIQTLSDLVTVKYVIEKVVILEDAKWYGESRVMLLAHGIVKAGIDLGELKPGDIEIEGKKITIKLPMERITDAYLDDRKTQVIERTTGVIRQFDKDLEQNARKAAVADIRTAARVNGILKEAGERARLQLRALLIQSGFQEVEFTGGN